MLELVTVALLALAPDPFPEPEKLVAALSSGSLHTLVEVAGAAGPDHPDWWSVRDFVGANDCVEIERYHVRRTPVTITLQIEGNAIRRNGRREKSAFSQTWIARAQRGTIVIESEEQSLARALLDAPDDDTRLRIAEQTLRLNAVARILPHIGERSAFHRTAAFLRGRAVATGDRLLEANGLSLLAATADDRELALYFARASSDVARELDDPDAIVAADLALANLSGDLEVQHRILGKAWEEIEALDDPRGLLLATEKHAHNLLDAFDISRAYAFFDRIESRSRAYGWDEGEARGILGRARVAYVLARQDEAKELASKVVLIGSRINNRELEAEGLTQVGLILSLYKHDPAGIPTLERALERVPRDNPQLASYVHSQLGFVLALQGRHAEAELHWEPAFRHPAEKGARRKSPYWFASRLRESQGRFEEAIAVAREGLRAGADLPLRLWDLNVSLGEMLLECGRTDEAIEALQDAVDIIEIRRKLAPSPATDVRHFGYRIYVYQRLVQALIRARHYEEALEVAERMRARALGDVLSNNHPQELVTESERAEQRVLSQRIVDLNRRLLASTGAAANAVRRELLDARAALDAFTQEVVIRRPRAVDAHAERRDFSVREHPSRPVVLEYALRPDGLAVFIVRGASVTAHELTNDRPKLEQLTATFLRRVAQRDLRYAADARALYDALIAPIADHIRDDEFVYIVPDGFLWNVPFDVLLAPSGKHLVELHAIAYAPSIAILDWTASREEKSAAPRNLLAFGGPRLAGSTAKRAGGLSLEPLTDAVHEVRSLARLYGDERSTVLTGSGARETVLKKLIGEYRIVHLATHGILDDASPFYSALVLASAETDADDGLLEMREVRDLDVRAELIVLSGCDTARGEVHQGEGVIGLSWAFLMAGCPTTVVSQWKAASQATADLMIEFHKRLLAGDSKAQALRQAKLSLLRDPTREHPYYWAPFIIMGEGSTTLR